MFGIITIIFLIINSIECKFNSKNITDLSKCEVYYCRHGASYVDFFEIQEKPMNGSLLDLHFSVLTSSDAHILLAASSEVTLADPAYEIVIGAGGNTFCDIRRMQKSSVKATVRLKGLLSGLDPQSFWLHISKDGVIEVGKDGSELAFITWIDPDPLPLKVFSFSTWPGVEAKWFFNCPTEDNSTLAKEVERPLLPLEKLRKDLLFFYDPYVRPVENVRSITPVGIQISTKHVTLDEHKSHLLLSGTVTITWQDQKLKWNISEYGNISILHIFRREIWVPNLYLFNAVAEGNNILEDTLLRVNSTGFVTWKTPINMISWCNSDSFGRWPRDEHSCEIVLGFYREFQNLQLIFDAKNSTLEAPYTSKWQIFSLETYSNTGWANSTVRNLDGNFDPPGLTLHFKMIRSSNSYNVLFFTPFIIISVSLLITFWISPFSKLKLGVVCLQLIISSMILIGLGMVIPIHSQLVPNLVYLYSYTLVASVVCVIIEIVVINFTRNDHQNALPHFLQALILSFGVKQMLCLPVLEDNTTYGNLNRSSLKMDEKQQNLWVLLGVVIDRIAFFVYVGLVVYALFIHY